MAPFDKKQYEKNPAAVGSLSKDETEPTSLMAPASGYKYQFDFEIGYLVQSPCKRCCRQTDLPKCADGCRILDGIHTMLSTSVSCTRGS